MLYWMLHVAEMLQSRPSFVPGHGPLLRVLCLHSLGIHFLSSAHWQRWVHYKDDNWLYGRWIRCRGCFGAATSNGAIQCLFVVAPRHHPCPTSNRKETSVSSVWHRWKSRPCVIFYSMGPFAVKEGVTQPPSVGT